MARECKSGFINTYINYTRPQQSPTLFHTWTAISTIASALRRRVWIDRGYYTLYPNLYTILVSESGVGMKSTAIKIGTESLLRKSIPDVTIMRGKLTMGYLVDWMVQAQTKNPDKLAEVTVHCSEFKVFARGAYADSSLIEDLTDLYDCVDDQTEILTKRGWQNINTISQFDHPLTLNLSLNTLEYKPINFIVKKEVDEIVLFESRALNQVVTPKHNVVYKYRNYGKLIDYFKLKSAQDFVGKKSEFFIPLSCSNNKLDFPISDELIQLAAWVITEGSISSDTGVRIAQNEVKLPKILMLLEKLGFLYSVNLEYKKGDIKKDGYIANFDGYRIHISQHNKFKEFFTVKNVPWYAKYLSERQFDLFLETLADGDGTNITDTNKILTTASKELVDKLQELAVMNGWASSYTKYKERNAYQISFNKKLTTGFTGDNRHGSPKRELIKKSVKVWCVNTDNNTIIIRRNGKVSITGNCGRFEYRTKNQGVYIIEKPCVNIIAASTPEWLTTGSAADFIGGGFSSRIIPVALLKDEKNIAWPDKTQVQKDLEDALITDLTTMSKLVGPFLVTSDGKKYFKDWYDIRTKYQNPDQRMKGYYSKKHDIVLKVAMILSISINDDLVITEDHVESALQLLGKLELNIPFAFQGVAWGEQAKFQDKVMLKIQTSKEIAHSELLQHFHYCMTGHDLKQIIQTLLDEDRIEFERKATGGKSKIIYKWKEVKP